MIIPIIPSSLSCLAFSFSLDHTPARISHYFMVEFIVSSVSSLRKRSARMAFTLAQVIPGSHQHNVQTVDYNLRYLRLIQLISVQTERPPHILTR
jgi:hypothetical protein